jgi:hypothetical protein
MARLQARALDEARRRSGYTREKRGGDPTGLHCINPNPITVHCIYPILERREGEILQERGIHAILTQIHAILTQIHAISTQIHALLTQIHAILTQIRAIFTQIHAMLTPL